MKRKGKNMRGKIEIKKMLAMLLVLTLVVCGTFNSGVVTSNAEEVTETDEFEEEDCEDTEEDFENCDEETELSCDETVEVTYNITSKWDGHYNIDVTLVNISGEVIDDWEMCFEFKDKIENIWNAKVVECEEGESVVIKNADWNQDINVDNSVTFGMTVSYEGEIELPQECYLTRERCEVDEEDYSIEYIQHSKWEGYVNGQIVIINTGNQRIEDWKLDFETTEFFKGIENIWNAKLLDIYEDTYCQIDNATYNQNIEPGQSVEFGFIAKCDGDFAIKKTTLYNMNNVEYEDGTNVDEIIDPDSDDWEPDCDLDDFDTYEEYVEYLKEIGYFYPSVFSTRSKTTAAENFKVTPFVKNELTFKVPKGKKVNALQSYLWDGEKLLTLFRKQETPASAYLCQAEKKVSGYSINQGQYKRMIGFSHGQSLERFTVKKNAKKLKKYMFCAGAGYKGDNSTKKLEKTEGQGWSKNVVFVDNSDILGTKEYSYKKNYKKIKKIIGLNKVGDVKSAIKRVDAAISSDGKVLVVWCSLKNYNKRQVSLYDMGVIKKYLYEKNNLYYNMSSKKLREDALITTIADSSNILQPNNSFQSIEVSQAFGDSKNKWQVYITSGNEGKGQNLTITRFTMTKGEKKLKNHRLIYVQVPYNKEGTPILTGTCEIEGCHIKGDDLQFILTNSKDALKNIKADKAVQYIVGVKKTVFSDVNAKV